MKLTLTVLIIALLLIFDQVKTGGQYRNGAHYMVQQAITRIIGMFR